MHVIGYSGVHSDEHAPESLHKNHVFKLMKLNKLLENFNIQIIPEMKENYILYTEQQHSIEYIQRVDVRIWNVLFAEVVSNSGLVESFTFM